MSDPCRCGLAVTAPIDAALSNRFDQLIGWAKSGKQGGFYLMDEENVDTLRDHLLAAVAYEFSQHPRGELIGGQR